MNFVFCQTTKRWDFVINKLFGLNLTIYPHIGEGVGVEEEGGRRRGLVLPKCPLLWEIQL